MAITLGKDCSITVGGTIVSARSVTLSGSARTVEIEAFGSRYAEVYSTGFDGTVSVEFNDSADAAGLFVSLQDGTEIVVSGGSSGWSFPAVVTGLSETFDVAGVATFSVEAKMTRVGLR